MPWGVDGRSTAGILALRLEGQIDDEEMKAFVAAHDRAVDDFGGAPYRIFCDIRGLKPLSPSATSLFERAKRYSADRPNFQGSAVLVSSVTIAMQHRRTSISGGVMATEMITDDERACRAHLSTIRRSG